MERKKQPLSEKKKRQLILSYFLPWVIILALIIIGIAGIANSRAEKQRIAEEKAQAEAAAQQQEEAKKAEEAKLSAEEAQMLAIAEKLKNNDTAGLKVVFLTFDDGPSDYTNEVLDILKTYNVKATFFSKGGNTELAKAVWPRLLAEGHTLANHSMSHDYSLYKNPDAFYADVQAEQDFQKSITGQEPSMIFRFPGGSATANQTCCQGIVARGYNYADWNVSSTDAAPTTPAVDVIVNAVVSGCQKREVSVVLCHGEVKENTRFELPTIIQTLKDQGYVFMPMDKSYHYPRQIEV